MLSSERSTVADDHDESDLWERLRSEANRRSSMLPPAPSEPPPEHLADFGAAFDSEPPSAFDMDSDLPPSPYESAQHYVQSSSYPPPLRESYAGLQMNHSEAEQLAQYEAEQAQYEAEQAQYDSEQTSYEGESGSYEDGHDEGDAESAYAQQEYAAQQYAHEQYNLQQFSQPQAHPQQGYPQQGYPQQPMFTGTPEGFAPSYPPQQVAAYGHVAEQQPAWGYQAPAPSAPFEAPEETGKSSRWGKVLVSLVAAGAIAGAGYQFVLVPRRQAERAAELAELQQRQAVLMAQQEKEQAEAAARAEAEQKAANEAALKRADEAAAAAAAAAQLVPDAAAKGDGAKAKSSAHEERERKRAERHERRAARAAAKAERGSAKAERSSRAERSSKSDSEVASTRPSKRSKQPETSEADNDDPLLGL
ncbi:MAG TPA: hypothetical protein VI299_18380 [Polyangiales bacterium]